MNIPIFGMHSRSFRQVVFQRHAGGRIIDDGIVMVRALDDVTFSARNGDRIALIGRNGSGKTTMLRVLAGVYHPTSGAVRVSGRISALLNVGLAMDPEADAYENIMNVGMMLRMSSREIREKADSIAEFTGLGEYLKLPVRTYSSGMMLRLSFSIVTAIEPEVLLLDEGFGTGDAQFTTQAQTRINTLIERSNVLVLATHSEELARQFCNRALLLEEGRVVCLSTVEEAFERYRQSMNRTSTGFGAVRE